MLSSSAANVPQMMLSLGLGATDVVIGDLGTGRGVTARIDNCGPL
jgi:hypothetical protein